MFCTGKKDINVGNLNPFNNNSFVPKGGGAKTVTHLCTPMKLIPTLMYCTYMPNIIFIARQYLVSVDNWMVDALVVVLKARQNQVRLIKLEEREIRQNIHLNMNAYC